MNPRLMKNVSITHVTTINLKLVPDQHWQCSRMFTVKPRLIGVQAAAALVHHGNFLSCVGDKKHV